MTDGRIYLVGDESRRREPRWVDYLLRYNGQMIAVLEAKEEKRSSDAGLEQAKSYARLLDVPFAYSSNGHAFVEFDFFTNKSRELTDFPAPDNLWLRWQMARTGEPVRVELAAEKRGEYGADPLLHPFERGQRGSPGRGRAGTGGGDLRPRRRRAARPLRHRPVATPWRRTSPAASPSASTWCSPTRPSAARRTPRSSNTSP